MWSELLAGAAFMAAMVLVPLTLLRLILWIGEPLYQSNHDRQKTADLISRATTNPYKIKHQRCRKQHQPAGAQDAEHSPPAKL